MKQINMTCNQEGRYRSKALKTAIMQMAKYYGKDRNN